MMKHTISPIQKGDFLLYFNIVGIQLSISYSVGNLSVLDRWVDSLKRAELSCLCTNILRPVNVFLSLLATSGDMNINFVMSRV